MRNDANWLGKETGKKQGRRGDSKLKDNVRKSKRKNDHVDFQENDLVGFLWTIRR